MRFRIGTSGYSYKEWKGSFYPADIKPDAMLKYYASKFGAVEINNTFYRMPTEKLVLGWAAEVPDDFQFILKAPQRITHRKKLEASGDLTPAFVTNAKKLGPKLGGLLFQLPPYAKKDVEALSAFLALLDGGPRAAFEFRHASWMSDDVHEALKKHGAALCLAESDDTSASDDLNAPLIATAKWGYLRLRRTDYTDEEIAAWAKRLRAQPWDEVLVFLKHEDEGKGPLFATKLIGALRA